MKNPKRPGNPTWVKGVGGGSPGRPKGSKNKLHQNIVENILDCVAKLEEEKKSLYDAARENPPWFYENFYKPLIPKNINLTGDMQLEVEVFIGPKKVGG